MAKGAVFALVVLCALVGTTTAAGHETSTNRLLELARIMSQLQNGEQPTLDVRIGSHVLPSSPLRLLREVSD